MEFSQDCRQCPHGLCIHRVPLFSSLSRENLLHIAGLIQHKGYDKGQRLISEGQEMGALYIINAGRAKAFRYTPEGREQILYLFSPGDFFGEQYLFSDHSAAYHVEALTPVLVCFLQKAHLQNLLLAEPQVAVKLVAELGKRIARLENTFQSIGIRSVDARIATLLLDFSDQFGEPTAQGIIIKLPVSREGMANYLGVARETLSRKLRKLERANLIRSLDTKTLLLLDRPSLASLAGLF